MHLKGATECFECQPKPVPRSFPICTLRNTPDRPIHCIVWSKDMLFNRLFGKPEEISGVMCVTCVTCMGGCDMHWCDHHRMIARFKDMLYYRLFGKPAENSGVTSVTCVTCINVTINA